MNKLFAFVNLLRKGAEISDGEKWKKRQIDANIFGGFVLALVAVVKAFGMELPVDEDTAYTIGGGIVAIVNVILTAATSKKAGILPEKRDNGGSDSNGPQGLHKEPMQDKNETDDFDPTLYAG